ncbi:hypothetical protein ACVWWO_000010 [Bradyrhizobium sp. F1.13.1]
MLGEVVSPLPIASVQMMKYFVGIQRFARSDHEVDAMVISGDCGHHQDGIGFIRIQDAVRHV